MPTHTGLLITHLNRILYDKANHPEKVEASIAELRAIPTASQAATELIALLGLLVSPTPATEVVPVIPVLEPTPESNQMFFKDSFDLLSKKLDEIISILKSDKPATVESGNGEVTSPEMCKLAAKILNNPKSTKLNKKLAGALLTQCPDKV